MPARHALPTDDLYATLGVPVDASPEAIELAWRALLRRHHPDVAGEPGLELAKRINVAHDWLADPVLRARYDRDRGLRHASGPRSASARGGGRWHPRDGDAGAGAEAERSGHGRRATAPRADRTREARFLERVAALSSTEIDRLSMAEPAPIAFGATIRRFLPPERQAALDSLTAAVAGRLPAAARRAVIRDVVDAYATELAVGPFLDELLSEPFRARARERLTRGWEAAVGQPRYGPNTVAVEDLLGRLAGLDGAGLVRLARGVGATGAAAADGTTGTAAADGTVGVAGPAGRDRRGGSDRRSHADPWPSGLTPDDDEALRVSAALAQRDALDAVRRASGRADVGATTARAAGRAAARIAHLLVLRHAFAPADFVAFTAPWRPWLVPIDPMPPTVRRPGSRA